VLLLGVVEFLLALPQFSTLRAEAWPGRKDHDTSWWIALLLGAALPAVTLLPFFQIGSQWLRASHWLPQAFTNEIAAWALLNAALLAALWELRATPRAPFRTPVRASLLLTLLSVAIVYLVVCVTDVFFKVDFRVWFIAFKPMSPTQARAFLVYLLPMSVYFVVALRALHSTLTVRTHSPALAYGVNLLALTSGILLFLAIEYGSLITTHHLRTLFTNDPLRIIVAINFVPLLAIAAIVSTFTFRRTNSYLPGAFICGALVAWYAVVGQATQSS